MRKILMKIKRGDMVDLQSATYPDLISKVIGIHPETMMTINSQKSVPVEVKGTAIKEWQYNIQVLLTE